MILRPNFDLCGYTTTRPIQEPKCTRSESGDKGGREGVGLALSWPGERVHSAGLGCQNDRFHSDARWQIYNLTYFHPFSSDQMIRNLSLKKWRSTRLRATAQILGTPCLACDRLFTGIVVNSRAKGTAGDPARCLCMQPPVHRRTVLIGYCDYHPVTKSPKIRSCDYSQMTF